MTIVGQDMTLPGPGWVRETYRHLLRTGQPVAFLASVSQTATFPYPRTGAGESWLSGLGGTYPAVGLDFRHSVLLCCWWLCVQPSYTTVSPANYCPQPV